MLIYLCLVPLVLALLLGYLLYTPIPARSKDPTTLRIVIAMSTIMHHLGRFFEMIGLGTYPCVARKLTGSTKAKDADLEIKDSSFRGVAVRIYRHRRGRSTDNPGMIFIHGGGFVFGSVDAYDAPVRELVKESVPGLVAISIEYRLSPEYPYPTPFEDCYAASCHFLDNAAEFGVDQERIAIVGDSAGGGLVAAVMNKMIVEKRERKPKLQVLIYPALQGYNFRTPSYLKINGQGERGCLTSTMMAHFWTNYAFGKSRGIEKFLQNAHIAESEKRSEPFKYIDDSHLPHDIVKEAENYPKSEEYDKELSETSKAILTDPYFSPLLAPDAILRKYPQTFIITTDFDPLRDDGIILEDRLRKLGVNVKYNHMVGHDHSIFAALIYNGHRLIMSDIQQYMKDSL